VEFIERGGGRGYVGQKTVEKSWKKKGQKGNQRASTRQSRPHETLVQKKGPDNGVLSGVPLDMACGPGGGGPRRYRGQN